MNERIGTTWNHLTLIFSAVVITKALLQWTLLLQKIDLYARDPHTSSVESGQQISRDRSYSSVSNYSLILIIVCICKISLKSDNILYTVF